MYNKKIDTHKLITTYENDLLTLASRLWKNSTAYLRINSIIKIIRLIDSEQTPLLEYLKSDQAFPKKLKDLYEKLYSLLTENNYYCTWFTKIVEGHCNDDLELKQRLNNFIQQTTGPVIKLSEFVRDKKRSLAIEFPNQETRDAFLNRTEINSVQTDKGTNWIVIENNIVYLQAFLSQNQLLGVTFKTVESKDNFIHILRLNKANLIMSNSNDSNLYINDRRIHDTTSRFHIALICPYFTERYRIQYTSHILHQAQRDCNSFFSQTIFPKELALKIASNISSSDAISMDEKMQIAVNNFCRP